MCESLRVSECLLAKNKRVDLVECGRASVFVCLCVLRKSNAKLVCCLLARARGFRLVLKRIRISIRLILVFFLLVVTLLEGLCSLIILFVFFFGFKDVCECFFVL